MDLGLLGAYKVSTSGSMSQVLNWCLGNVDNVDTVDTVADFSGMHLFIHNQKPNLLDENSYPPSLYIYLTSYCYILNNNNW